VRPGPPRPPHLHALAQDPSEKQERKHWPHPNKRVWAPDGPEEQELVPSCTHPKTQLWAVWQLSLALA
jgi:hypothetical protein